jgi:hypothetical protein
MSSKKFFFGRYRHYIYEFNSMLEITGGVPINLKKFLIYHSRFESYSKKGQIFSKKIYKTYLSLSIETYLSLFDFDEKKAELYFHHKGGPLPKKSRNFFLIMILQFIHQSIALVEFSRNMMFLNFFEVISSQK